MTRKNIRLHSNQHLSFKCETWFGITKRFTYTIEICRLWAPRIMWSETRGSWILTHYNKTVTVPLPSIHSSLDNFIQFFCWCPYLYHAAHMLWKRLTPPEPSNGTCIYLGLNANITLCPTQWLTHRCALDSTRTIELKKLFDRESWKDVPIFSLLNSI